MVLHMQVTLNGETHELTNGISVAGLLDELELNRSRLAVEINEEVLPREMYDTHRLAPGDVVEIVQFIGGG